MTRRGNQEAQIQAAIVQYLRTVGLVDALAIPNGGLRSKPEAARLKWQGVLAGAPDLVVPLPDGRAMWLEVKAPKGVVSPEQREFGMRRSADGGMWAVVRSITDVQLCLKDWGVVTRDDNGGPA